MQIVHTRLQRKYGAEMLYSLQDFLCKKSKKVLGAKSLFIRLQIHHNIKDYN
jgi:hypothetical protein